MTDVLHMILVAAACLVAGAAMIGGLFGVTALVDRWLSGKYIKPKR